MGQKGCDLAALNSADLLVVRSQREQWDLKIAAQIGKIVDLTVQHYPSNSGGSGGACHLGHGRAADWLENDSIRVRLGIRLNDLEQLLTLDNGIILGVHGLNFDAERGSHFRCFNRLLHLVIVVVCRE